MDKKCTICGEKAKFAIKDTNDYYCEECAEDSFGDITVLIKIDEQAKKLKAFVDERIEDNQ